MTNMPQQIGRTSHVVTKRQEDNSAYTIHRTSFDNTYFPFPDPTQSLPYHFTYPYGYVYPYTYYSNLYYPPYSYLPSQHGETRAHQRQQNIVGREMENEVREQSHPVQIKIELQEQPSERKPVQKVILPIKKKQDINLRTIERKDYKRRDGLMNSQLKQIFNRLIQTFISEDPNLNKEKADFKKSLKITQQNSGYDEFFELLFQNLKKKFAEFRKTKEEMIKYIIRRTYHNYKVSKGGECRPELDRLQLFHQKNLTFYKSMNSDFLRKQFSNKLFVEIYKEFLDQMDEQFQRENEDRIQRLALILTSCWVDKNMKVFLHEKKLPWNMNYKRKVKQIACDLLKQFQPPVSEKKQEIQEPEIEIE